MSAFGDWVDLRTLFFKKADHALVAHEPSVVAFVPHGDLIALCDTHPNLAKMLWHDTLVDSAIFREWALNIGHRRAPQRIGALFFECEARLAAVGRAHESTCELKLTQQELASAVGLSLVHFHKSLRRLREMNLVASSGRRVKFPNKAALAEWAEFDPAYLHIATSPRFEKAENLQSLVPQRPSSFSVAE